MAKNQPRQSAPKQKNTAPKQKPTKRKSDSTAEELTAGNILWRLALILCVGLCITGLLFASINGGAKYVGITTDTTPSATPPMVSTDPNVTVNTSDATPIPPSPTSGIDPTPSVTPDAGQPVG